LQCETQDVNWRTYATRLLLTVAARRWLRSGRDPTDAQVTFFSLAMPLLATFAVAVEVLWFLTGRGRRVRHALGYDEIQVVPGARGLPPDFRERWDSVVARKRAGFEAMKAELERKQSERRS
jgi:hypothetical protein